MRRPRRDYDILPLRISTTFRKLKTNASRQFPGKKRSQNRTVFNVVVKVYLVSVGVFILYHLELVRSSMFFRFTRVSTTISKENENLDEPSSIHASHSNHISSLDVNETKILGELLENSTVAQDFAIVGVVNDGTWIHDAAIRKQQENETYIPKLSFPEDYEQFTVRINTWKREEQLKLALDHYSTCSAIAQIQIIWCLEQGEPPNWLQERELESRKRQLAGNSSTSTPSDPPIVIERHANNTLNERFLELEPIPTAGVLSVDDDVIRPCLALYSAFIKWTLNPDRQVGFDARSHVVEVVQSINNNSSSERWSYAYKSTTTKMNKYSITLTRFSFQHRYYLKSYWVDMPEKVRDVVAEHFNCEDIAMSLWISSRTRCKPPLLADYWAVNSQIQMYVPDKISGRKDHKHIRNMCFDMFADLFQLKGQFRAGNLYHSKDKYHGIFDYGVPSDNWNEPPHEVLLRTQTNEVINRWKIQGQDVAMKALMSLIKTASQGIFANGLIEKTHPWKVRFQANTNR